MVRICSSQVGEASGGTEKAFYPRMQVKVAWIYGYYLLYAHNLRRCSNSYYIVSKLN